LCRDGSFGRALIAGIIREWIMPFVSSTPLFYENVTWDGNIKKKIGTIYNYKHCIAVDLISKHNQTGTMLGRVRYMLFIQLIFKGKLQSVEQLL
jgi:hypothetical protein